MRSYEEHADIAFFVGVGYEEDDVKSFRLISGQNVTQQCAQCTI